GKTILARAISGRFFTGSKEDGGHNMDGAESARVYPFPAPVETVAELRTRLISWLISSAPGWRLHGSSAWSQVDARWKSPACGSRRLGGGHSRSFDGPDPKARPADVAAFRDTPAERIQEIPTRSGRKGAEKPDHRHSRLLRARHERPGRRAAR